MLRTTMLTLCLVFAGEMATSVRAQDYENNPNYIKETHWEMHVIAGGGRVVEKQGPFPDYQSAERAAKAWDDAHPDNIGLLAVSKEITNYRPINRGSSGLRRDAGEAPRQSSQRPGYHGGGAAPAERVNGRWEADCGPFFFSNGSVQHICSGQACSGSYQINGNSIYIQVGKVTIRGTISGGMINGTIFKNGGVLKNISMQKS